MFLKTKLIKKAALMICLFATSACSANLYNEPNTTNLTAPPIREEETAPTLETTTTIEFLPDGVLVDPGDESSLNYFDVNGNLAAELNTPGKGSADPQHVHLAGSSISEGFAIPVIYHSWDPGQALLVTLHNDIHVLRASDYFYSLAGAPGQSAIAFSEVMIEENVPHSYLYAGDLDNLDATVQFYDLVDETTQMALRPVAMYAIDSNPQGVWYTKAAWGIGGADLIYDITRGLYYYDLTTGNNMQYLDTERNFQGISPDQTMAASIPFDFDSDRSMTVTNLSNSQNLNFPLKSSSDRGAGYAIFSHDNQYIAWLEASGSYMDQPVSYQSVVRIGDLASGNMVVEIEDSIISQYINGNTVSFMKPVGWLDNQTLLIQVHGEDWGQTSLMAYSMTDNTLAHFCDGSFVGFAYP